MGILKEKVADHTCVLQDDSEGMCRRAQSRNGDRRSGGRKGSGPLEVAIEAGKVIRSRVYVGIRVHRIRYRTG